MNINKAKILNMKAERHECMLCEEQHDRNLMLHWMNKILGNKSLGAKPQMDKRQIGKLTISYDMCDSCASFFIKLDDLHASCLVVMVKKHKYRLRKGKTRGLSCRMDIDDWMNNHKKTVEYLKYRLTLEAI